MRAKSISVAMAITLVLGLHIPKSSADSNSLRRFYNDIATTADSPQLGETPQGHVLSGGNLRMRSQRPNMQIAYFDPPRMNAGCGGIDIFAGTFGVISADALAQSARAIAQGVAMYYLGVAIDSISPISGNNMKSLLDKLMELNQFSRQGCQEITSRIDGFLESEAARQKGVQTESDFGMIDGPGALIDIPSTTPGSVMGLDPERDEGVLLGNNVRQFVATARSGTESGFFQSRVSITDSIFGSNANEVTEFLMALVPTVINERDEDADEGVSARHIPPAYTVEDLFLATSSDIENNPDQYRSHVCLNEASDRPSEQCTMIGEREGETLESFHMMLGEHLEGEGSHPGLQDRIFNRPVALAPTEEQQALFSRAGITLNAVANYHTGGANERDLIEFVRYDYLRAIADRYHNELDIIVKEMSSAVRQFDGGPATEEVIETMEGLVNEFGEIRN